MNLYMGSDWLDLRSVIGHAHLRVFCFDSGASIPIAESAADENARVLRLKLTVTEI